MASTIKKKKVFLILTLFSVASNLTVNKNTVSPRTKLLIQPPFKIIPLQFFFCNVSLLNCSFYCWFIYLCICFHSVFRCFLSWRGRVFFSHFSPFTSCGIQRSHFLPVIWSTAFQKQLSGFKSKMGGVGVILNYWTQAETWAMDMAPDFRLLHFFLCLCQLQGFLSVVRTMRGWCGYLERDVLYSDLVQMHPIMIMFCYLCVPPAPFPLLWKSALHKQLQRLLPFNQSIYSCYFAAEPHSQQVWRRKKLHMQLPHTCSHTCTQCTSSHNADIFALTDTRLGRVSTPM